ncbi:MAG: Holliday junction branch migration protein RuvA [Candidatus Dormibacter sp.]|uniref:Holliday junction branch migration protein RuvA n=1 Tax=Candidatus Dormibacter sp. TaxID=2973982 RepID=UPI00268C636E
MIGHLRGRVIRAAQDQVVLDVGGVGYLVSLPASARESVPAVGAREEAALHIHTVVREDQLALYGFASAEDLELFQMLIQVDGVGPKVALAILSVASRDVLKRAILADDVAPIRRASGVGARTAQKVIIDLKPRLQAEAALLALPSTPHGASDGEAQTQVESALRSLGFSAQQAKQGLDAVDWKAEPAAQAALAAALKALGR